MPSHADHVIDGVTDVPVELDRGRVRRADLQVYLRAADFAQPPFCLAYEQSAQPLALMVRMDREVVNPSPVAFIADHHRPDQFAVVRKNHKIGRVPRQLAVNIPVRVIPRPGQLAQGPKRNKGLPIAGLVLTEHRIHELRRYIQGNPVELAGLSAAPVGLISAVLIAAAG